MLDEFEIDIDVDFSEPAANSPSLNNPQAAVAEVTLPAELGPYTLEEKIAVGGMAEIFRATRTGAAGFSKRMVVKRILPHLTSDPAMVEMFLREAHICSGLSHSNIAEVFDLGEDRGQYFIAMEYVDGMSLKQLAKKAWSLPTALPLELIVRCVADAARGLNAAHAAIDREGKPRQMVHRDISPDNLMVTPEGTVKVLDFGVAKIAGEPKTERGILKGKIPFMAPELIRGEALDGRVDLYALGVTLYWLLTAQYPYERDGDVPTLRAILDDPVPDVRAINPFVPPRLSAIIRKLMDKDRGQRFTSGRELADELTGIVPGLPLQARTFLEELQRGTLQPQALERMTDGSPVRAQAVTSVGRPAPSVKLPADAPATKLPVLGIDLGTTNSSAAWVDEDGYLEVVEFSEDETSLPSVVSYRENGMVLVGSTARAMVLDAPETTVYSAKRFIGRRYASEFVARNKDRVGYRIVEAESGAAAIEVFGKQRPLEDVLVQVLARVLDMASVSAGFRFEECVVTVPAHFTFRQRELTREAASTIIKVKAVLNEPTAAALYHGKTRDAEQRILVFDLGGGTFDATVLETGDGVARVIATGGDSFLGGADFDFALARLLAERFEALHGTDPFQNDYAAQRLIGAAEFVKIELSDDESTQLRVPGLVMRDGVFLDLDVTVTRADLEAACAPLIEKALGIAEDTVARAGLSDDEIDECILVGGQTQMPAIASRMAHRYAMDAEGTVDPTLAVALGAAFFASRPAELRDVLSVPLNLALPGRAPGHLIAANTTLPADERVALPAPAGGKPLVVLLFESVTLTSVDRDILGRVTIPAQWIALHPGTVHLRAQMTAAGSLTLTAVAADGEELPVALDKATFSPEAPTDEPQAEKPTTSPDLEALFSARMSSALAGEYAVLVLQLSSDQAFVSTDAPLPLGSDVELAMASPAGEVAIRVRVARVDREEGRSGLGAGLLLEFYEVSPEAADRIVRLLGSDDDVSPESTATLNTEGLSRLVSGVKKKQFYAGLDLEPAATTAELETRLAELRTQLDELRQRSPDAKLVAVVQPLLERFERILLDDNRRLLLDFRTGHVRVRDRLRAASRDPKQLERLRLLWTRAHPAEADRADQLARQAQAAIQELGATAMAIKFAREALALHPFLWRLRVNLRKWNETMLAGS